MARKAAHLITGVFVALVHSVCLASGIVFSGAGGTNTSFTAGTANAALLAFESSIGGVNNGSNGPRIGGFRAINWDAVPLSLASPSLLPANYYNTGGNLKGVVLITPGSGVAVSQGNSGPNANFGNIDPSYATNFQAFSPTRLFSPIGSNIVQIYFYAPGTNAAAGTRGFGAIFNDVDALKTSIRYFGLNGKDLGTWYAPVGGHAESVFLGVLFSLGDPPIGHVVITLGDTPLGAPESGNDLVVMDDIAYAEPIIDEIFADGFE